MDFPAQIREFLDLHLWEAAEDDATFLRNLNVFEAVKRKDRESVERYFDLKNSAASIHDRDEYGNTVLYYACLVGDIEMVKLLKERGARDNGIKSCWDAALTEEVRNLLRGERKPAQQGRPHNPNNKAARYKHKRKK